MIDRKWWALAVLTGCVTTPELSGTVAERLLEDYPASFEASCAEGGVGLTWSLTPHPLVQQYAVAVTADGSEIDALDLGIASSGAATLDASTVAACTPCTLTLFGVDAAGMRSDALVDVTLSTDGDGDGFAGGTCGGVDCDDTSETVNPNAEEACDGIDNDCNSLIDDLPGLPAADLQDGVCVGATKVCDGSGAFVEPDYGAIVGYEAIESTCDGLDNDCSGATDDIGTTLLPAASQQAGVCAGARQICEGSSGWAEPDYTAISHYEALEVTCDGLDNDCSGQADDLDGAPPAMLQHGVCAGVTQVCDGSGGFVEPDYTTVTGFESDELACDGLDNDCNGLTDDLEAPGPITSIQDGVCAGSTQVCAGVHGFVDPDFTQIVGYEAVEVSCDQLDNDCDGDADSIDPAHAPPASLHGGVCSDAVQTCASTGWVDPDFTQIIGYESPEISCDGLDNDCSGQADDLADAPPAQMQLGVCAGLSQVCDGSGGFVDPDYTAVTGFESVEVTCDGLDNDCNGATDDTTGVPPAASLQAGVCAGSEQICNGAHGFVDPDYTQIAGYETLERTCDDLDNDCDGAADVFDITVHIPPGSMQLGVCAGSEQVCDGAHGWVDPEYGSIPHFEAHETLCDGLDNDCNGIDDDLEGAPPADVQHGVCAGATKACDGSGGFVEPDYGLITGFQSHETLCDGLDNDCNAVEDDIDPTLRPPASNQNGVCHGATQVCGVHGFVDPDYGTLAGYESPEASCDALDNDCDGTTDGALPGGPPADLQAGECSGTNKQCADGHWIEPDYEAVVATYESPEHTCDGLDNDCNAIDDDIDPGNAPLADLQHGVCLDARQACFGGQWSEPSYTHYTNDYEASETRCDGLDNDCDGEHDVTLQVDLANATTECFGAYDLWVPTLVSEGPYEAVAVNRGARYYHFTTSAARPSVTCVIDDSDALLCTGSATFGMPDPGRELVPVAGDGLWESVAITRRDVCGIHLDGSLYCWGYPFEAPALVTGGVWEHVSPGWTHTCAIDSSQALSCWGDNDEGQLGPNILDEPDLPTPIGFGTWIDVSAGDEFTCGIQHDQTLWCWGANNQGQSGAHDSASHVGFTQVEASAARDWMDVETGEEHACALATDGSVWCWGDNYNGKLGNGSSTDSFEPVLASAGPFDGLALSIEVSCAVSATQGTWCWGYGGATGEAFGNEAAGGGSTPQQVSATLTRDVGHAEVGGCGLDGVGALYCWGPGSQRGVGPNPEVAPWVDFAAVDIDLGSRFGCYIDLDEDVWCWGRNHHGQAGVDTGGLAIATPLEVAEGSFRALSLGDSTACAIENDGTLYCWGFNNRGQAADGTLADVVTPTAVPGEVWSDVSVGYDESCGVTEGGALLCWGRRGNFPYEEFSVPTPVAGSEVRTWVDVEASSHLCALDTQGDLYCWGSDSGGQLGQGFQNTVWDLHGHPPVEGGPWRSVAVGGSHTCAVKEDHSLWCWGGNGDTGNSPVPGGGMIEPTPLEVGGSWLSVTAGPFHSCGIALDHSVHCWGGNEYGQTPISNESNLEYPEEIDSGSGEWQFIQSGSVRTCGVRASVTEQQCP